MHPVEKLREVKGVPHARTIAEPSHERDMHRPSTIGEQILPLGLTIRVLSRVIRVITPQTISVSVHYDYCDHSQ